ncbi:MAG: condensation domain-containing protein, partial [Alphaproteobacteria bacterium]
ANGFCRIHFSIDELIVDGLSIDMLLRQWGELYANPSLELPEQALSFRDYVLAMKAFEDTLRYRQDLAYWGERLTSMPGGPQFPQASGHEASEGARRRVRMNYHLSAPVWEALKERADTLQVSPASLVLSIFAEVLRVWTNSADFTLVMTYFNRPPLHPHIRELIGPAISSLLFTVEQRPSDDFEIIVKEHYKRLLRDLDHASVSGIRALRQLRGQKSSSAMAPLSVVFTSMLGSEADGEPLEHLGDIVYAVNYTPQVHLDHQLRERAGGVDCSWDVAESYFEPGYIEALFKAYCGMLEGLAGDEVVWMVSSFARPSPAEVASKNSATALLSKFMGEAQHENQDAVFALTDQQQAYAFGRDTRLPGGGSSCQVYQELIAHNLDVPRLEQALAALIERHPMLRTVVNAQGSQALLASAPRYTIEVTDLRQQTSELQQAALKATRQTLLARTVPLGEWPYFTLKVSLLDDGQACIHLCVDMLIADSTSIGTLLHELITLYEKPDATPPAPIVTFRTYQRAVEQFKTTANYAERVSYWNRKFAKLPAGPALPQLPVSGPDNAAEHKRVSGVLNQWTALRDYAQARGLEPGMILFTAYLEVLYAWNGQQPLAVVAPAFDRLPVHAEIGQVIGDFTALSWVTRQPDVMSFEQRLQQVCQQYTDDMAQRPVSGLQALRRVVLKNRQKPLSYPVVFTSQITQQNLPGKTFELGASISKTPQVYLDNISSETGPHLHCHWDFADSIYAEPMITEMFEGYMRLLELLANDKQAWQRLDFGDLIKAQPLTYRGPEGREVASSASVVNGFAV